MPAGLSMSTALARRTAFVLVGACALCLPAGCARHDVADGEADHHGEHEHTDHDGHGHEHDHDSNAEHAHDEEESALTEADIDMPRDYASAVARLQSCRQQILEALAEGHAHEAHRPLDEMDLVNGKLMGIARASGVPRRDWEEVNLARRELRAQFDLAHAAIDRDQPVDRAALEQSTAAPLARLTAIVAKATNAVDAIKTEKQAAAPDAEARP